MFQPQTGTAPDLDSIANYTLYSISPASPVSNFFWTFSLSSSIILPPISSVYRRITSLAPGTHLFYRREALSTWTSSPPSTHQPPTLNYVTCAAYLRLSPFPASVHPHFTFLRLQGGPCQPLGVRPMQAHISPLCLRLSSLCSTPTPNIFWFLVSCKL